MHVIAVVLVALAFAPAQALAAPPAGPGLCDYCRMEIDDARFGGEIEGPQRKKVRFDSSECMAAYQLARRSSPGWVRAVKSADYDHPGVLLDATKAFYLVSDKRPSPMGVGISAYRTAASAQAARRRCPGRVLTWAQVLDRVRTTWYHER